jgi:hypothetical protein
MPTTPSASGPRETHELVSARLADSECVSEAGEREVLTFAQLSGDVRAELADRDCFAGQQLDERAGVFECGAFGLVLEVGHGLPDCAAYGVEVGTHGDTVSETCTDPLDDRPGGLYGWESYRGSTRKVQLMHVQKLTPKPGVTVLQVEAGAGALPVARVTQVGSAWTVRALLAGHEETVATEAAAEAIAMEDIHEVFPGTSLELVGSLAVA